MKVIQTVKAPGNEPVDIVWGITLGNMGVIHSVAAILDALEDQSPWTPETISITIEI